jgi:prepilin-type N-terminal cleavage/methylation domain-containing protein
METSEKKREGGFTLIELLIAIVVVGVLTAVAIVGIAGLTNQGSKSACAASRDAAKAATAVYYSNHNGTYPASLSDLTGPAGAPLWEPPSGLTVAPGDTTISTNGWTLTMTPGTGTPIGEPTFACTP